MKNVKTAFRALLCAASMLAALPASAQQIVTYVDAAGVRHPVTPTDPLPTTGGGGGGGGGAITAASGSYAAGALSAGAAVDGWNLTGGALGDAACATDNGSCSAQALLKRENQRLSSILAAIGSPLQAGGSIGNTSFGSTVADGGNVALGAKADPKSTATDTTPASTIALLKGQIDRLQAIVSALGSPLQAGGSVGISGTLPAGENHVGEVGSRTIIAGASFTTPSGVTAYSSGQLIANSATAGSVTPMSFTVCRVNAGTGMVRRARIKTTDTGFASGAVRLHLWRDSPTVTNGDHATFLATESNYIGALDITLDRHFSDYEKGIGAPVTGSEINYDCASSSQVLYGLIEAQGAITPQGAKTISVVLETLAN